MVPRNSNLSSMQGWELSVGSVERSHLSEYHDLLSSSSAELKSIQPDMSQFPGSPERTRDSL